jgi:hypothetical protein
VLLKQMKGLPLTFEATKLLVHFFEMHIKGVSVFFQHFDFHVLLAGERAKDSFNNTATKYESPATRSPHPIG